MSNRAGDWLTQATRDLAAARAASAAGLYEWTCFAAQQAAEKAAKGLLQAVNGAARGHGIAFILTKLAPGLTPARDLVVAASRLDKYYTVTRYPNGFDAGAPGEHFLKEEAETAVKDAESIVDFCRSNFPR